MITSKPIDQNTPTTPIHIVGAGPVGLLLANLLGQQGREVRITDARTEPPASSMAIGITPPSLDILHHLGLRHRFEQTGVPIQHARVYESQKLCGKLHFRSSETGILSLPQFGTVQFLEENLSRFPSVHFERGITFGEKDFAANTDLLIGCDGAHSTVRDLTRIPLRSHGYGVQFVMADFPDHERLGPDARLFFSPRGAVESFPLPNNHRRWIAQRVQNAPAELSVLTERVLDAAGIDLSGRDSGPVHGFDPRWALAKTYVQQNVILCGDAAHVMSPIGGQGMNTGFADAWMLAQVLQHPSPDALSTYTRTRQLAFRVAARRAAWGMFLGTRTGTPASVIRATLLKTALHTPKLQQTLARTFSMRNLPHPVQVGTP